MKNIKLKNTLLKAAAVILTFGCTALPAMAGMPPYATETGYWVVESNTITKDFTIIKFYDSQHQLMYEEKMEGVYLNIKKRKHVKMLNNRLKMVESNHLEAGQIKAKGNK
jgi:hypothetical protein